MFETFNVRSMYISLQAVLALYANGRTTGCVLESGDGISHSATIYEGFVLPHAMRRVDLGGSDITTRLRNLLMTGKYRFKNSTGDNEIVGYLKENLC